MEKVNQKIFKAYDIRGIYPEQLNEKVAFLIGQAFVKFLKRPNPRIVVGRDNRSSSPVLAKNLIKGILKEGGKVIDIGLSPSPMLYWALAHYKFAGGVEITASHNPPQYNGLKLVKKGANFIGEKTGLREIKKIVQKLAKLNKKRSFLGKFKESLITKKNILKDYIKFNLKDFDLNKLSFLKIVFDTGNAVSGILIKELKKKVPFKIYPLFSKLDSQFPNRSLNPLEKGALKFLKKEVLKKKADLGVAFDGDGDRICFVSEKGKIISSDLIFALFSKIILREKPGQKFLYNVCSSKIIPETIKKEGGISLMGRVGHVFIKERMKKEKIAFAGEFSGHFYVKSHYFSEAPLFVLFKILEEMANEKKTISQLIKPFQKYFHSGQINIKISQKPQKVLRKLEKKYKKGKISHLDGLRIDFKDWWFNIRPSQTEPLLRLVVEAKTKKLMEKKKNQIRLLSLS